MEEEHLTLHPKQQMKPRYSLGKITNKHLIIELYGYVYLTREEAMYRFFKHNKLTRELLIKNLKLFP